MVSAPAGYCKTAHVANWAEHCGRPVAWIDLERHDNDPQVLLARLTAMLRGVEHEALTERARPSESAAPLETVAIPEFGHVVSRCDGSFVLVLDDLHTVDNAMALDLITTLAHRVNARSTVVLIGRSTPPPSFAAMSMDPGFVIISMEDLALDSTAARSVTDAVGWHPDDDELDQLVTATDGCPVGIRLAAMTHHGADDRPGPSARPTRARHRLVADFVHEKWLRELPADDVEFLRNVSGLGSLSGGLCDQLLGRSDSGEVLERLRTSSHLVIPLDYWGGEYRLHRMLDNVLDGDTQRTAPDAKRRIAAHASVWFERNDDPDGAIRQALRADDIDRAVDLVERHAEQYQTNGAAPTVDQWMALLPRDRVFASSQICLMSAVLAMVRGQVDEVSTWLRLAEQAALDPAANTTDPRFALKLAALRSALSTGDVDDARADAERAYSGLGPGRWHALACLARGQWHLAIGDTDTALRTLFEGAAEARLLGAPTLEASCLAGLGFGFASQGDWTQARSMVESARRVVTNHDLAWMPTLITVTSMIAWAEATAGDPDIARTEVRTARAHLAHYENIASWANMQSRIALIRACLLLGDQFEARTLLDEAVALVHTRPFTAWAAEQLDQLASALKSARTALPYGPSSLTAAELRMLHFLPTNLTIGGISQRLFVSRNTAKSHATAIYRKLGVSSRGEAVEMARRTGLLTDEPTT